MPLYLSEAKKSKTPKRVFRMRRTGRTYIHKLFLLNKLSVCICVHPWFFNTIRGFKKWFCPTVTQRCDKCDRIAQYSFFFVTLFHRTNILN